MKKRIFVSATAIIVVASAVVISVMTFNPQQSESDLLLNENIEALTEGEEPANYNICYYESKVQKGYSYYDCGSCRKVYDERGKGTYSKCFY